MLQITEPNNCTGCQACRLICPYGSISIIEDNEGFQVPSINQETCTDCGACAASCPQNNRPAFTQNSCIKVLGAKLKNDALLAKSASGGVFAGIAANILEESGNAVFGCAFDENIVARHVCVTDIKEITPLQSSKYVQSDVGDTYMQAQAFLEKGKTVFYTGTPCQIAGLYAFLGRDYDNLLTADLICHGVPSPLLFKRYINWLGKKQGGKIIYYDCRCKEKYGWGMMLKIKTKVNNKVKTTLAPWVDPYSTGFSNSSTMRECCYSCKYANTNRVADITLGDFWGVDRFHPEFYDAKGVSVVLINSQKGDNFFKTAYKDFEIIESTLDIAANVQDMLRQPSPRIAYRNVALSDVKNEQIDIFNKPYFKPSVLTQTKARMKFITPSSILTLYRVMKIKLRQKG